MLEQLFTPQAVAILGASRNPAKVGHAFVANLLASQYAGKIVPINPEAKEVLGVPCYRDLREYGGKIDLGVIVVPPRFVKQGIQDCIDAGAKVVTVITAGFKEVSAEGAAGMQARHIHYVDPAPFLVRSTVVNAPVRKHATRPAF